MATSVLALSFSSAVFAQDAGACKPTVRGAVVDDCAVESKEIGKNTEQGTATTDAVPFKISVDGETVSGSDTPADEQRRADVELDKVDIQVKFDGLDAKQILAVKAEPVEAGSSVVKFRTSTNYARFISRGEVRVFKADDLDNAQIVDADPVAVVDVSSSDLVEWSAEGGDLKDYYYVYRVYDEDGRFDETGAKPIIDTAINLDVTKVEGDLTGDQASVRNISVYGGAVTVFGRNIPEGYDVNVFGKKVTADASNQILFQQILPPGDQDVEIAVAGGKGSDLQFTRQINIPKNDWFYVAIADLTIGHRF
ncbi:MAG: TonB-dependent receptor, partial [Rhizobiaceae bacterium]